MTFEKIWNDLESGKITPDQALLDISKEDKMKVINYYIHYDSINKEPLSDIQLQDLNAIVNILQPRAEHQAKLREKYGQSYLY